MPKLACLPWACSKSARKSLLLLPAVTLSGEDPAVQYEAVTAPHHLQSQETAEGRWSLTLGSGFLMITAIQDQLQVLHFSHALDLSLSTADL